MVLHRHSPQKEDREQEGPEWNGECCLCVVKRLGPLSTEILTVIMLWLVHCDYNTLLVYTGHISFHFPIYNADTCREFKIAHWKSDVLFRCIKSNGHLVLSSLFICAGSGSAE